MFLTPANRGADFALTPEKRSLSAERPKEGIEGTTGCKNGSVLIKKANEQKKVKKT